MHIKCLNKKDINLFFLFYFLKTVKTQKEIIKKRVKKGNLFDYH